MILKNLTIRSLDFSVKLTIYAEESRRYLCFNRKWKLVGSKKFRGEMCEFYEDMVNNGYNRYRSVANETHFVGFNRRGRPLRGGMVRQKGNFREKCLNFLKFDTEFSINHHNQKLAGGNHSAEVPARAHQQLLKNKQQKGGLNKHKKQSRKNIPRWLQNKNHHRNTKKLS
ncbi:hypothetical protein C0J52_09324 [Blattella germanica]|nr:hypothetical protein C0J52_09324 [Blattella germanica]